MKHPVQVSVDPELVKYARDKNINISAVINQVLGIMKASETEDAEVVTLSILSLERDKLKERKVFAQDELKRIDLAIQSSEIRIEEAKRTIEEMKKAKRVAALMRELNVKIEEVEFDPERISSLPVIGKLKEEGLPITTQWITRQISRVQFM